MWAHVVSNHHAMLPQELCVYLVGFIMISLYPSLPGAQRWNSCWFLSQKKSRFVSARMTKIWKQYLHDCGTKICPMLELSQLHSRKTDSVTEGFKESQWIWRLFAPTVRNQAGKSLHLPSHYFQEAIRRSCHVFFFFCHHGAPEKACGKVSGRSRFRISPLMAPTL